MKIPNFYVPDFYRPDPVLRIERNQNFTKKKNTYLSVAICSRASTHSHRLRNREIIIIRFNMSLPRAPGGKRYDIILCACLCGGGGG